MAMKPTWIIKCFHNRDELITAEVQSKSAAKLLLLFPLLLRTAYYVATLVPLNTKQSHFYPEGCVQPTTSSASLRWLIIKVKICIVVGVKANVSQPSLHYFRLAVSFLVPEICTIIEGAPDIEIHQNYQLFSEIYKYLYKSTSTPSANEATLRGLPNLRLRNCRDIARLGSAERSEDETFFFFRTAPL